MLEEIDVLAVLTTLGEACEEIPHGNSRIRVSTQLRESLARKGHRTTVLVDRRLAYDALVWHRGSHSRRGDGDPPATDTAATIAAAAQQHIQARELAVNACARSRHGRSPAMHARRIALAGVVLMVLVTGMLLRFPEAGTDAASNRASGSQGVVQPAMTPDPGAEVPNPVSDSGPAEISMPETRQVVAADSPRPTPSRPVVGAVVKETDTEASARRESNSDPVAIDEEMRCFITGIC